jgi:hypothetical protein
MANTNTYTLSDLWKDALSILPTALVGEDIESPELVIYTGLTIGEDGTIVKYNREDN